MLAPSSPEPFSREPSWPGNLFASGAFRGAVFVGAFAVQSPRRLPIPRPSERRHRDLELHDVVGPRSRVAPLTEQDVEPATRSGSRDDRWAVQLRHGIVALLAPVAHRGWG